jgi:hypothetical protein
MNSARLIPARGRVAGARPTTETGPRGPSHGTQTGTRVGGHRVHESQGDATVSVQPHGELLNG